MVREGSTVTMEVDVEQDSAQDGKATGKDDQSVCQ